MGSEIVGVSMREGSAGAAADPDEVVMGGWILRLEGRTSSKLD